MKKFFKRIYKRFKVMPELTTGRRVEFARKQAGLTQAELAERAGIGSRPGTISDIEAGRQGLGKRTAEIARACGTTTDFLLGLTDDPGRPLNLDNLPEERRDVIRRLINWLTPS
jgi:transcriptional regulator with XRE-family HTH domain